ncbi:hypothetical protein A1O3_04476 [Capronia epimyces CBS 606.96]|uniref:Major facilitator superfamily (MFS) profile domain-containing protein n=1 Tax=Capronia epimyces CBS 606.96 TaxID=1182542 RepID=W9YE26_9EURO|nr:uncharacterized protein A1O3_04476 [Capronia epimyces CBS 606.96]EXJ87516.1 hypothetical protein A1O3_04476 [Capronia epimyces CBS 606.96]
MLVNTDQHGAVRSDDPLNCPPKCESTVVCGRLEEEDVGAASSGRRAFVAPDGGFQAWLQVVGAFFVSFNSWGIVGTFGVFQTFYETSPSSILLQSSPSQISWIGSMQAFLLLLVSVLSGPAFDSGHMKFLLASSLFCTPLGFMMTSISSEYWHVMLAQGLCIGVGLGAGFTPSVSIVPQYFLRRRATALGMAATGASIGGVVYPILFHASLDTLGFRWSCRILGFVSAATLAIPFLVLRNQVGFSAAQKRRLIDLAALRNPHFVVYCLAMFLIFLGFLIPMFYVQSFAISKGIVGNVVNVDDGDGDGGGYGDGHGDGLAFYLLPILNAGSTLGRLLPNYVVDRCGPFNVLLPLTTGSAILALCWPSVQSTGGIVVFASLYGFFTGGMVSATAVPIISFANNQRNVGTYVGMCFFCTAFGLLAGPPSAGAILTQSNNYLGPSLFGGIALLLASFLLVAIRLRMVGCVAAVKV